MRLKAARSEEGSRDEIPCQGFGDEIPIVPMREAPISKNQREAEGANSDSDTLRKNFCMDSYRLRAALSLRGVGGNAFLGELA